ncbi:class I SAM-dependent methyltransferase [Streptomyces sp. NPDC048825]|uniref:class I SAM-dependent methyltransferase n=1 Tax=Streptomyces sp. NPDC048825 TaxID=3365592 RepID=UPI0037240055
MSSGSDTDLPPGQALDVGCGEGADAVWLAQHGWQVTAVDISEIVLHRAATVATATTSVNGRVAWARADLTTTPPPADAFDLVSIHYFPLHRQPGHTALHGGLLSAVGPGGTVLFATHARADFTRREDFDAADYYQPDDIAQLLDLTAWNVLTNETRPRATPTPAGAHHTQDAVLRAVRLP